MASSSTYSWPIVPIQTGKGYALQAFIDWSIQPQNIVFDFTTQGSTKQPMIFVCGALIDNSQNNCSVFISGNGFEPVSEVLPGDIATLPIIAGQYPVLMLSQGITPAPTNTGTTTITFTSWEMALAKTTQFTRPYPTHIGTNIQNGVLTPGNGIQIYSTSQAAQFFAIQNVSAVGQGQLLVRIANLVTIPTTLDSLQLCPLGTPGKNTLLSGEFGVIPSGNLWLGAFNGNVAYTVWYK